MRYFMFFQIFPIFFIQILLRRPTLMETRCCKVLLPTCASALKIVNTLIKRGSGDDTFDLDIEPTHGQPASCRARPMKVDGFLEDIRWIGREVARGVPRSFPPKRSIAMGERSIIFVVCFLHTSGQMFCICLLYTSPSPRD